MLNIIFFRENELSYKIFPNKNRKGSKVKNVEKRTFFKV